MSWSDVPEPPDPQDFVYVPGPAGAADANFTRFAAGTTMYVGVDDTNLRAAADTTSEVLDVLPLAAEVTVLAAVGPDTVLTDRRNVWYRIRSEAGERFVAGQDGVWRFLPCASGSEYAHAVMELVGHAGFPVDIDLRSRLPRKFATLRSSLPPASR